MENVGIRQLVSWPGLTISEPSTIDIHYTFNPYNHPLCEAIEICSHDVFHHTVTSDQRESRGNQVPSGLLGSIPGCGRELQDARLPNSTRLLRVNVS